MRLLSELKTAGHRVLALTNFSSETFPLAQRKYPFLQVFEGIVVSGEEGLIKPDPAIYELLFARYAVDPKRSVFIDDSAANIATARQLGMQAIHFTGPQMLRPALRALQLSV